MNYDKLKDIGAQLRRAAYVLDLGRISDARQMVREAANEVELI